MNPCTVGECVMGISTFKGGIHPPDKKELSADKPIVEAKPPKRVIIPLSQHLGAPCKPLVTINQEVKKGEMIGEPSGFVSAAVHSSLSGKVIAIGEFPNVVKLSPPKEKPIDTVIINGAECEPYLTADYRLMVEKPNEIIEGLKILMKVLGVNKGFVGIENNKPAAIEKMKEAAKNELNIEVWGLEVKYPQGAEKMLIKAITGRAVPPPPGLPMDVGVVVQNVGTTIAIYEAARYGKPLIERVVTVTGEGINEPRNLLVKIGTLVSHLIDECGGLKDEGLKVIAGGPMMGFAISSLNVPVTKGTSGIVVLTEREIVDRKSTRL